MTQGGISVHIVALQANRSHSKSFSVHMLKILDYEAWMLRRLGVCRARRLRGAKVDLHVDLVGLRILDVEFSVKCSC